MQDVATIRAKFEALRPYLDERRRRLWAAAEAMALGRGGVTAVASATGLQRVTIRVGLRELQRGPATSTDAATVADDEHRVRAPGGGRKPLTAEDPTLLRDLEALVEPVTRGDPMSPLRWTCKSTRQLAAELGRQGHRVSHATVAELLHALHYSLQGTRKTKEGADHPDRDAQFAEINDHTKAFQQRGQPVISVDAKKKELVGDFHNGGREWQPAGYPEPVRVHDFVDRELGKAIPYGVYDVATNQGWVSVGIDHDTAGGSHFAGLERIDRVRHTIVAQQSPWHARQVLRVERAQRRELRFEPRTTRTSVSTWRTRSLPDCCPCSIQTCFQT